MSMFNYKKITVSNEYATEGQVWHMKCFHDHEEFILRSIKKHPNEFKSMITNEIREMQSS